MRLSSFRLALPLAGLLAVAAPAGAQQQADAAVRVAPSGRATSVVTLQVPGAARDAAPATIRLDYGQPHARGRQVAGNLIPYDEVWRTGANQATTFHTDVDLEVGGTRVPRGAYTVYSLLSRDGWKLIINRQTGQWGTQYAQADDLGRVDMTVTRLSSPAESFTMTLVPSTEAPASGTIVLSWGDVQGTVPWRVAR